MSDPLKRAKRLPLLALNQSTQPPPKKTYDSSLKRHTSLLNKLRKSFSLEAKESILKEIDGLSLEKYAEEIVDACVEGVGGLGGKGDVGSVVEILTRLSTRLSSPIFLHPFLTQLYHLLAPPSTQSLRALPADQREREEKERVTKQRGVLRVLAEGEACGLRVVGGLGGLGLGPGKKGKVVEDDNGAGSLVEEVLKALLASDPIFTSLPLFASFLKSFGRLYLGPEPKEEEGEAAEGDELILGAVQDRLRTYFMNYYEALAKNVQKGRVRLQEQDLKNHEAYIKSGEIFEDRQQAYEKMTKEVERLMAGLTLLADLLHLPTPSFPTLPPPKGSNSVLVLDSSTSANPYARSLDDIPVGGMWEDEEQRKFYEDVIDLADFVPGGLLGVKLAKDKEKEGEKEVGDGDVVVGEDEEKKELEGGLDEGEGAAVAIPESVVSSLSNVDPTTTALAPSSADDPALPAGPLARLNAIFAALPEAVSKSVVDQLAVDFAIMNSKPSRKKVVKFLSSVPKNRSDLLPLYARFTAALDPYMPDVGKDLIAILDEEFRYLQRKRLVKELAEVRSKNIRYYSELAKFKVARPHTILHVFKVLVDDLAGANIEGAALLLENCGRFLLRSEETGDRMKMMLELLRRKQSAQHMDPRLALLLENAYYQCNPPERPAVQQKERTPMDLFIRHLLHDVLIKKTVEKVLKLVRKLHWEDLEVVNHLHKAFTKVWKLKFSNIGALAIVVYDLARFHSDFTTGVVDQVLENIRTGLETNIFKHNQRRIATMKYLGELHFYRQVNSTIIFDTLWSLITFGHAEPLPIPGRSSALDAADDFFRVRLICTLLETCGMCFDKGVQRKKLDQFLVVFQAYVMCKRDPPMDVDFMVSDTFDLIRPNLVPFKTMEQVGVAIDELLASQALQSTAAEEEEEREDSGSESGDEGPEEVVDLEEENEDKEEAEELIGSDDESSMEEDVEDDLVVRGLAKADGMTREEEDEFTKEFSKLLLDQADKKGDRKATIPVFDSAVPLMRRAQKGGRAGDEESIRTAPEETGGNMKFMLLTKKGNKPQTRLMDIPSDSALAINTRSNQMLDKLEQQQMKALVLNHDKRQEDSEKRAEVAAAARRGIKLKFVG